MLFNEAYALIDRLNAAAYQRLTVYARGYSYDSRAETDPYVARLDALIGRATRRAARRLPR